MDEKKELRRYLINKRNALENKLLDILLVYYIKYIKKIWKKNIDTNKIYKHFQKDLLKITDWSGNKIDKEYTRFINWLEEHLSISEEYISNLSYSIFTLNINITGPELDVETFTYPSTKRIFYKCLKSVARFFYDNPKEFEKDSFKQVLNSVVKTCLRNFIPLTDILKSIEEINNGELDKIQYNFDEITNNQTTESYSFHNSNNNENQDSKLLIEKESSDSLDLHNEYYNSDEHDDNTDKNQINNKENLENESEKNIKLITIPKLKKSGFHKYNNKNNKSKNLYKKNEEKNIENFFSDD